MEELHPAAKFLNETAFDTEIPNSKFGEFSKAFLNENYGIPFSSIEMHNNKIKRAKTILERLAGKQETVSFSILDQYRKCQYSLRELWKVSKISIPELKRAITAECKKQGRIIIKTDWDATKQRRKRFDLFEWIKVVHKHFSLRILCETINWSPKAVLDLCAKCNEAGYPVIAPKIVGADLQWLALYDPMLGNFDEARNSQIKRRRGGKEIFKRLLHQENSGRSVYGKMPVKTRKKRNASGGRRFNSRAVKVTRFKDPYNYTEAYREGGKIKRRRVVVSQAQRNQMMAFLTY